MTRKRLRPAWTEEELQKLYQTPHDHRRWRDHHLRVAATIEVGRWMLEGVPNPLGADLSCGNGSILRNLPLTGRHYGDFAPGYDITGPIEKTITEIPRVDMFVCSETIEHVDDPDFVLEGIREKTDYLLLSTPIDCWDDGNFEHLWAWSRNDVEQMMMDAGFRPFIYTAVDFRLLSLPYCFGIWGAR